MTARRHAGWLPLGCLLWCWQVTAFAQEAQPPPADLHEHVDVIAAQLTPTRDATGSAWLPVATPMFGVHSPWRGWDLRVDGVAFVSATFEPRDRHRTGGPGRSQVSSTNWVMGMARRNTGAGRIGLRTMLSAEPLTVRDCGTISFLATGEVCDGDTVHDRQPPHDLLMELSADYERALGRGWRAQVYAALAGEPALGPPGFPHRMSAIANPIGPVTHHWLDSTHVTFGVVTVGVHNLRWKAEVSAFNGREPDQSRVDVDLGALDSVAGRLTVLPTDRLAVQVSAGWLREALTDFPIRSADPATRVTASAIYHHPLGQNGLWATTVAYGANRQREAVSGRLLDSLSSGAVVESSLTDATRHTVFVRGELAGMPAHHLHAHELTGTVLTLGKLQLGYVRHFRAGGRLTPGIGATTALSLLPAALAPRYEGRWAPTFAVFMSLKPARHQM